MSLRDDLVTLFQRDDFTAVEFMDNTNVEALADAVLALLRQKAQGAVNTEAVTRDLAALEDGRFYTATPEILDAARWAASLVGGEGQ